MSPKSALNILTVWVGLALAGCAMLDKRPVDSTGPYLGDQLLWSLDKVLVEIDDTLDLVHEFAHAFPQVSDRDDVRPFLAFCEAQRDGVVERNSDGTIADREVLARILAARSIYLSSKTAANAETLRERLAAGYDLLGQVRNFLPVYAAPNPSP